MVPVALPPVLINTPVSTTYLFLAIATIVTLVDHSGLSFPYFQSSKDHDLHHERLTLNFGVAGWLDYLHGTDLESYNINKQKWIIHDNLTGDKWAHNHYSVGFVKLSNV